MLVLFVAAGLLSGCSPRLAPLYRDYEDTTRAAPVFDRVETALEEAGWVVVEDDVPNLVRTDLRTFRNWGLYTVVVELEAAALGDQYVRLYVHPYRDYITGGRSKIPFLKGTLREQLLPELNAALERQGLVVLGTPEQRDREAAP